MLARSLKFRYSCYFNFNFQTHAVLQIRAEEMGNLNEVLRMSFKAQNLDKKVSISFGI